MSAYVVSNNTIRAVIGYAADHDLKAMGVTTKDALGQILLDENVRSVNHRYSTSQEPEPFTYGDGYKVSPRQAVWHLMCIEYQSCETPDWTVTRAHNLLFRLLQNIAKQIAGDIEGSWNAPDHGGLAS